MATKNTLTDIIFAEQYLQFVASRAQNREHRARAAIMVATIRMLDLKFPDWRNELIAELDRTNQTRQTEDMFSLPEVDSTSLYHDFMQTVIGPKRE